MDKTLEELQKELLKISSEERELKNKAKLLEQERIKLHKQISSIKFGFTPTLEKICEVYNKDTSYLQQKEYFEFADYIREKHPYIRLCGKSETNPKVPSIELSFFITSETQANKYLNEINYLFSLLKPNEQGKKIIYFENYRNEIWELFTRDNVIGIKKNTTYSTYSSFETMQDALDYLYEYEDN